MKRLEWVILNKERPYNKGVERQNENKNKNKNKNNMKNTKLTAALVTETAKQTIINLRNEFEVTEKQLIDLVLKQALRRKSELSKLVEQLHATLEEEKEARLTARVAQYKMKAAEIRKVKSAEKLRAKLAKLEPEVEVESAE